MVRRSLMYTVAENQMKPQALSFETKYSEPNIAH